MDASAAAAATRSTRSRARVRRVAGVAATACTKFERQTNLHSLVGDHRPVRRRPPAGSCHCGRVAHRIAPAMDRGRSPSTLHRLRGRRLPVPRRLGTRPLSSLLVNGQPDRELVPVRAPAALDVYSCNPAGVAVYGEMVGILWSRGQAAAVHFGSRSCGTSSWEELPFSLLCGASLVDANADSVDLDRTPRDVHTYVG